MTRACGKSREAGFSVLEALVAMAILSAALLPLLALQGQFVTSVRAMERAEARISVTSTVQQQINALNLSEHQRGSLTLPGAMVRWNAEPIIPTRAVRGDTGRTSRYETTLYTVRAEVVYSGAGNGQNRVSGRETLTLRGLGWRPVRGFIDNL